MHRSEFEPRLIRNEEIHYDQSGNPYVPEYIDDVEIVNVPESTHFIRPGEIDEPSRELLLDLLRDALPHTKEPGEDLGEGEYFASCLSRGSETTVIPAEILIGTIGNDEGTLIVAGCVYLSFHDIGDKLEPKLIGFEIDDEPTNKPIRQTETTIMGTSLSPERYQAILSAIQAFPSDKTTPHPGTKEFVRQGEEYKELADTYKAAGLHEIPGAMFKLDGQKGESEQEDNDWTLVAVHPYYLEYHDSFGQRDQMTPELRSELMSKYDALFAGHQGSLVIVEEQSRILETLARLQNAGMQGDIFFVITEDRDSSLFPYTNNVEFMNLLKELGVENLKFIGGHDAGDKPYVSHDPISRKSSTYSGCLRGLANRIEKKGFPKVETIPGYTYS